MGSAPSKATPTPTASASFNEKRALAPSDSANTASAMELLARLQLEDAPNAGTLDSSQLTSWESNIRNDPAKILARTVLSKQNISDALINPAVSHSDVHVYNVVVPRESAKVTNQKSSGRCWLFAATNIARRQVVQKYSLDEFELSQSYLYFYDTLEKCNYFLENMIELADQPLDDRAVQYLMQEARNDGGQIDLAVNIFEKYGMVPQSVYPESFSSSNTSKMNNILASKLREYAIELRGLYAKAFTSVHESWGTSKSAVEKKQLAIGLARKRKTELMSDIYTIISLCLTAPPRADETFVWEYYDKDHKYHKLITTPLDFYKSSGFLANTWVSLIHDPRNEPYKLYTVDRLGNVWNGRPVLYVNAPIEDLKAHVVSMLKAGLPVWFGCDVGAKSNSALGVMDTKLFDYQKAFGTEVALGMSKADRLRTGESLMTHAMCLTAVHLDDHGKPVRFRVENSWGSDVGDKGFFLMSDAWFDAYLYQVAVPRSFLDKKLRDVFDQNQEEAIRLPCYDPLGSLA